MSCTNYNRLARNFLAKVFPYLLRDFPLFVEERDQGLL